MEDLRGIMDLRGTGDPGKMEWNGSRKEGPNGSLLWRERGWTAGPMGTQWINMDGSGVTCVQDLSGPNICVMTRTREYGTWICDLNDVRLGSSEEVPSGTSGDNEEVAALQDQDSPGGGPTKSEHRPSTDASWDEKTGSCLPFQEST
ncbi:hypothetical protein PFLUV_G00077060 [Perca fluviatilis]|uniref:Uncharacterized protein n=1 Tax=Perca fluviatilis TaxID=8168 RepID=A0A6A5EKE8_PERFL|nr:hypothetical protein PFLUV_G00077060 [Perca fluviatilis]